MPQTYRSELRRRAMQPLLRQCFSNRSLSLGSSIRSRDLPPLLQQPSRYENESTKVSYGWLKRMIKSRERFPRFPKEIRYISRAWRFYHRLEGEGSANCSLVKLKASLKRAITGAYS